MTALSPTRSRVLRRKIPSRLREVEAVCLDIRELLRSQGLEAAVFPVELLARECLANAVIHGSRRRASECVDLDLRIGRTWIRLQVTDQGDGFNWRGDGVGSRRDDTKPNGRGLSICALYAHRVAFNQRGNRITLWLGKPRQDH